MKRTVRTVVATALTTAVALGVSVPAASAAPQDKPSHAKAQSKSPDKSKAAAAAKKAAAAAKRAAAQQRQLVRTIEGSDARLARVVDGELLTGLPQDVVDTVTSNVAADRDRLAVIRAAVEDGGPDFRPVLGQVRAIRVETYHVVVGVVRGAADVTAESSANDVSLAALDPAAPLVVETASANSAAALLAQDAVSKALLLTATSPVQDRGPAGADIEAARELLEQVATFLGAQTPEQQAPEQEPAV